MVISIGNRAAAPLEIAALLTLVALAPTVLVMLTSFTRVVVVLSIFRQALGLQQTPPNIVITGMALCLTATVMSPTFTKINSQALSPYLAGKIKPGEAIKLAEAPMREFMLRQTRPEDIELARGMLEAAGNKKSNVKPEDMPFFFLVPAFVSSELTTAFKIGFLVYLPFLAIDLLVSSVLMSLGMFMLPPATVAIPIKLLVFILGNGWPLLFGNLIYGFK